jgi:hypothetical protein
MVQFYPVAIRFLALLLAASVTPWAAIAAEEIGAARLVVAEVSAQSATATRRLVSADAVAYQELIATQREAAAVIVFVDGTELAIGEQAQVRLDDFVFDPGAAGVLTLSIRSGALRFATGSMRKDAYRIETPSAVLTVRGTRFDLAVAEDGTTYLHVLEGQVNVTGANGEAKEVAVGQSVNVSAAGVPSAPALASSVPKSALSGKIGKMDAALAEALPDAPPASLSGLSVLSKARGLRAAVDREKLGRARDRSTKDKKGGKL